MTTKSEIDDIQVKLAEQESIRKHLASILITQEEMLDELAKLEGKIQDNLDDIMKLEELSVTQIIHKVIGNKDEKLEEEREEYLEHSVAIKNVQDSLDLIQFERSILEQKQSGVEELEKLLEILKLKRLKEILHSTGEDRDRLEKLITKVNTLTKVKQEVNEALYIADEYRRTLRNVLELTKTAGYWHHQNLQYGNRRTYANKVQAVERAIFEYGKANILIGRVVKEMTDIQYDHKGLSHDLRLEIIGIKQNHNSKLPHEIKISNSIFVRNVISEFIFLKKLKSAETDIRNSFDYATSAISFLQAVLAAIEKDFNKYKTDQDAILMD